jgi:hypothetical protein
LELLDKGFMADMVKTASDIGIQDVFGLFTDIKEDGTDRIMTGTSRAKSVAIWFKFGFPLGFQGHFDQSLLRPITHHRDAQRALFCLSGLGDIHPSDRLRLLLVPVFRVETLGHSSPLCGRDGFDSINPCGVLALIVLCDPSHGQQMCRSGLHQQFLEFVDGSLIATLFGSKDALLDAVDMLLKLSPGQLVPTLTLRIKLWLDLRCLRISHPLAPLSSLSSCLRQQIQGITPGFGFLGNPALKCLRPGRLLVISTSDESVLESYPVPMMGFAFP